MVKLTLKYFSKYAEKLSFCGRVWGITLVFIDRSISFIIPNFFAKKGDFKVKL